MEILFEDRLILAESQFDVLLQLTSESLLIRHRIRQVTIERHPRTRSFGFSIKGGHDTGNQQRQNSAGLLMRTSAYLSRISCAYLSCCFDDESVDSRR